MTTIRWALHVVISTWTVSVIFLTWDSILERSYNNRILLLRTQRRPQLCTYAVNNSAYLSVYFLLASYGNRHDLFSKPWIIFRCSWMYPGLCRGPAVQVFYYVISVSISSFLYRLIGYIYTFCIICFAILAYLSTRPFCSTDTRSEVLIAWHGITRDTG